MKETNLPLIHRMFERNDVFPSSKNRELLFFIQFRDRRCILCTERVKRVRCIFLRNKTFWLKDRAAPSLDSKAFHTTHGHLVESKILRIRIRKCFVRNILLWHESLCTTISFNFITVTFVASGHFIHQTPTFWLPWIMLKFFKGH